MRRCPCHPPRRAPRAKSSSFPLTELFSTSCKPGPGSPPPLPPKKKGTTTARKCLFFLLRPLASQPAQGAAREDFLLMHRENHNKSEPACSPPRCLCRCEGLSRKKPAFTSPREGAGLAPSPCEGRGRIRPGRGDPKDEGPQKPLRHHLGLPICKMDAARL